MVFGILPPANVSVTLTFDPSPWKTNQFVSRTVSTGKLFGYVFVQSLQQFSSYRVHKTRTAITACPWPLIPWP